MHASDFEEQLRELVIRGDREALDQLCVSTPPALIGEILGTLDPVEIWRILAPLPADLRAEIFGDLQPSTQLDVVDRIGRGQLAALMDSMESDDRADFFKRLDPRVAQEMLPLMAQVEREDLKRLARAEEGTVGAAMSTDYAVLPPDITAAEALVRLRQQAPDRETIYYVYVLDGDRRLVGFVSLKDIILARGDRLLRDFMRERVISIRAEDDQEVAADVIERYDLFAVPVVDENQKLVGIVTHDDALDILREEEGEDLEHFGGLTGPVQELPYLEIPFWVHYKRRVIWIVGLLGLGLFSGLILRYFEASRGLGGMYQALTIFVPMLINTGGNAGQQSVTTIIRSLVLDQIEPRHCMQVVGRELGASALLSVSVTGIVYLGVLALASGFDIEMDITAAHLALIVTLALAVHIVVSALIGALLPLAAVRLKLDPTVIASPALTTLADLTGLIIYFSVALMLLP